MIRNRILLKSIAVFLLLETVFNTVAPTISWALTSGPTAPEATSFEPVDTTDMVNLLTGDLAYNIPLLEVPGPSGGYPLSLSYHAGIQPNEDASWVGLGFTLNPGAIVRNVNGFADDQKQQNNASRYFWEGGHTKTYSIGVSVGLMESPASVSAGLSFSQDTYQGFGIGMYLGVGYTFTGSNVGIGATIGVSPYGDPYASAGLHLTTPLGEGEKKAGFLSAGLGINTNFQSVGFYGSAGVSATYSNGKNHDSGSVMGATISTGNKGISASVSIAGASVSNNSASHYLSTSTSGFDIPIPVWYNVWVNHGYSYQRYWIDEIDYSYVNGALYYPNHSAELSPDYFDDNAYDTYSLLDPTLDGGIVDNPTSDKVLGGSFPGFDNYLVHAQGVSGYMRPYYFQRHLYKRNNYSTNADGGKDYQTIQYDISKSNSNESNLRAEFRFINDFSNRFEFTPGQINLNPSNPDQTPLQYNFSTGSDLRVGENGSTSYTSNDVQGSNYVTWFTNDEIVNKYPRVTTSGFMETSSSGFTRSTPNDLTDDDNIGGFVIVNQSGVKYHFALPAYSFNEYAYSGNKTGTETFNEFLKGGKYAYTWYLTGITGPDYIDRGPDGTADGKFNEYDWGYWVEFEYGKWTDQYAWRNPSEGMASDLDANFQNFSSGVKEIYYLDAIHTKTHTALFVKDIRHDGKGVLNLLRNVTSEYFRKDRIGDNYTISGRPQKLTDYDLISAGGPQPIQKVIRTAPDIRIGGFTPKSETCSCQKTIHHNYYRLHGQQEIDVFDEDFVDRGTGSYTPLPTSTLKLKSIVLIKNSDLSNSGLSKLHGEAYAQTSTINWQIASDVDDTILKDQCDFTNYTTNYHFYQNVLDIDDFNQSTLKGKALRVIEFDSDEKESALSPGTANSFDFNLLKNGTPSLNESDYPRYGKLTLNGISFLGKGGANLLPPMKFQYELENPSRGNSNLSNSSNQYSFYASNSGLIEGDILNLTASDGKTYYGVVINIESDIHYLKIFKNQTPPSGSITWQQTKNPPYDKDASDIWGLFKSDFDIGDPHADSHVGRLVSDISAKSLDVWSLRSVETSTGAKVKFEYESDSYAKPVLYQSSSLVVENVKKINDTDSQVTLANSYDGIDKLLSQGNELAYTFLFVDPYRGFDRFPSYFDFSENLQDGVLVVKSASLVDGKWEIVTASDLTKFYRRLEDKSLIKYSPPIFVAGNIKIGNDILNLGGGIRLRSIEVTSLNKTNRTTYDYTKPAVNAAVTSGVTSYEPGSLDNVDFNYPLADDDNNKFFNATNKDRLQKIYKKNIYKNFGELLANSREIPPPGVLYEYVKVQEYIIENAQEAKNPNYTQYQFEVFNPTDVTIEYSNSQTTDFSQKRYDDFVNYSKKSIRNVTLKDYTSRVGSLKTMTLYNNDKQIISKTTNSYLHDDVTDNSEYESKLSTQFNNQGVIEESFSDARFASRKDTDFELQGVVTKREQYPSIQIGQTTVNYKTGITTTTRTLAFDYYSGQATRSQSTDGHGNVYFSESTPAYRQYSAMGPAVAGGKNMLTQEAASYTYKVDPNQNNKKTGLVSASIQTWSDQLQVLQQDKLVNEPFVQPGIWRKASTFTFVGSDNVSIPVDGLYPAASVTAFNAWNINDPIPDGWQKTSAITLFDVNSHALEAQDVNSNFAATRMSSDQSRVIATAANANYREFAYSGAEDKPSNGLFGSDVYQNGASNTSAAHTGSTSITALAGGRGFTYYMQSPRQQRTYRVSVWSSQPIASIKYKFDSNGEIIAPVKNKGKAGNWYLLEADIAVNTTTASKLELWCEAGANTTYFDDFRVRPVDAAMTSYVYNQWGEVSHILDNNNLYTEYRYDAMGRLTSTYKESFKAAYGNQGIVKTGIVEYNYGVNNPYTLTINTSSTGTRGYIYPSGNISVAQGKDLRFELRDKCQSNTLAAVWIDGKKIDVDKSSVTLADGTTVSIQNAGKVVTFKNVQTAHTLKADFASNSVAGVVVCNGYTDGNGNTCFDGGYRYAYYDLCGNQGSWMTANKKSEIPYDLRSLAVDNCCQYNNGLVSGCNCKPGSTGIE